MHEELTTLLNEIKSGINARLDSQSEITDKIILPKLNSIENQAKKTNSRVSKLEARMDVQEKTCKMVQDGKNKEDNMKENQINAKKIHIRWAIGMLVTIALGITAMLLT